MPFGASRVSRPEQDIASLGTSTISLCRSIAFICHEYYFPCFHPPEIYHILQMVLHTVFVIAKLVDVMPYRNARIGILGHKKNFTMLEVKKGSSHAEDQIS
ncbi:hypothetical protein ACJX0J_009324 [Zea mays]